MFYIIFTEGNKTTAVPAKIFWFLTPQKLEANCPFCSKISEVKIYYYEHSISFLPNKKCKHAKNVILTSEI